MSLVKQIMTALNTKDDLRTIGMALFLLALWIGAITAYFWENIRGNQHFKAYCETEAGLRVFKKAQPDRVWLADSPYSAVVAASFDGVAFARYVDTATGRQIDVHRIKGTGMRRRSYEHVDADLTKVPVYGWRSISAQPVAGGLRLTRSGDELYELKSGELLARYYDYGFFMFDPAKTPFSSPAPKTCLHNMSTYRELQNAIQS